LLLRFIEDDFADLSPTIGVDFKLKNVVSGKKRLRLTIWDTAGQERFRTLTSSYYRGAAGLILVYDVTRRETFSNLADVWLREVDLYSTVPDAVRLVVANKCDLEEQRAVTRAEGVAFAKAHGCLFLEVSAKSRLGVEEAFEELVGRIAESPSLLASSAPQGSGVRLGAAKGHASSCGC
jgi:Ras-related protein Rab-18